MWQWLLDAVASTPAALALGAGGWLITHWIAGPLVRLWEIRRDVHECLYYTRNVTNWEHDQRRYEEAQDGLRRFAARLDAIDETLLPPVRRFLRSIGYDLNRAVRGLTGLSNTLGTVKGERAINRDMVQVGLKLRRDYSDADIASIKQRLDV